MAENRRFIPELHGVRGLSAVWVMLFHDTPAVVSALRFPGYGYLGVDVFFLLSGYVLMHTHAAEFRTLRLQPFFRFLALRWWRVYPLYGLTVLAGIVVFHGRFGFWPSWPSVAQSALLLERWALPGIGVNGVAWSLGVEWVGYLAFPFLALFLVRLGPGVRIALALLPNILVAACIARFAADWNPIDAPLAVPRMAAEFTAGCLLFTFARDIPRWHRRHGDLVALLGLLALCATLATGFPHAAVLCLALVVFGVAGSGRWSGLLLANRPVLFLGRISFALYITHWIVLGVVRHGFPQPPDPADRAEISALFYAISLPLATLCCLAVEEPARRWQRRRDPARRTVRLPGRAGATAPRSSREPDEHATSPGPGSATPVHAVSIDIAPFNTADRVIS